MVLLILMVKMNMVTTTTLSTHGWPRGIYQIILVITYEYMKQFIPESICKIADFMDEKKIWKEKLGKMGNIYKKSWTSQVTLV